MKFTRLLRELQDTATGKSLDIIGDWLDSVPVLPQGTMKAWFQAHHGERVETFQFGYNNRPWLPGLRTVDASAATYVVLGGSRRDYRGMRVIASDPTSLVVESENETICYRVARG